jgi:hypothetical protein
MYSGLLTVHNILSPEHYGFRSQLKTDNAVYQLTTAILIVGLCSTYSVAIY